MSSRSPPSLSGPTRRSGRFASSEPTAAAAAAGGGMPAPPARLAHSRPTAGRAQRSRSRSRSGSRGGQDEEEEGDPASESSGDEEDDALVDVTPIRASAAAAPPAAVARADRIVVNLLTAPGPNATEAAADPPMSSGDDDEDEGDDDGPPDDLAAAAAGAAPPAPSSRRDTVDLMDDGSDDEGNNEPGAAAAAAAVAPVVAPVAEERKRIDSSERSSRSAATPSVPPSPISTRRSSERKGGDSYGYGYGYDGEDEVPEAEFEFADLSTPAQRYDAMMRNCPAKEALVRLVRLVARPAGSDEEGELVRDPLMVAKLYHGNSPKNLQRCSDFLRHFSKQPSCQAFLERLTDRKLKSYETSLRAYLERTGGIAPIDLSSIASKLAASKPDSVAQRDREGFAPAYPNSVAAVIVDLCNVILNACKFNPPGHFVHEQALDLADKLPKALGSLRRQLKLDEDEIVCFTCGNGDSDEDSARGVLMQCESCSLWYHQGCANVPVVPRDSWYCQSCVEQNPKLMLKRARQAAALYASVAGLDHSQTSKQRAYSPAPRTQSRNDAAGSVAAAPSPDVDMSPADAAAPSGSKRKLDHTPSSGSDAATKKARNETATATAGAGASRSQPKSGGASHRGASPIASSSSPPPTASASSAALDRSPPPPRARVSSPDGRWMRLQSLAIKDRTPGGGGLFSPVIDFGTDDAGASTAAASARAEDESDLRALRTQLDGAMRTLAASSERLVDLQEKQRVRARRAAVAKAEQAKQAAALQQLIDTLTAPVEPDVDAAAMDAATATAAAATPTASSSTAAAASSPAAVASASAPAAATAAGGAGAAAAPVPSGDDLAKRLSSYRHRFVSLTRLVAQQKDELAAAHASAAALAQHYDDVKSEAVAIHSSQQTRIVELENALATLKAHLLSERRARNLAVDQCTAHQRLARRMVQRLDLTVVGSPIPAQFGTKLLAEVRQAIDKEMAASDAANNSGSNAASNAAHKREVAAHAAAIYQLKQPETPTGIVAAAAAASAATAAAAAGAGTSTGLNKVLSSPAHNHPLHRHTSHGHSHTHTPMPTPPSRQGSGLAGHHAHSGLQPPALHHQQSSGSAASAAASPAAAAAAAASSASSPIAQLVLRNPHLFPHLESLYRTLSSYMSMPSDLLRALLEQKHAQLTATGVAVDLSDLAAYFERQQQQPQARHKGQSQQEMAAAASSSSPHTGQSTNLFGPSALTSQSSWPTARSRGPMQVSPSQTTSSSQMNSQSASPQQRHLTPHPSPTASTVMRPGTGASAASAPSNHLFGPSSTYTPQAPAAAAASSASSVQPSAATNGGDAAPPIARASKTGSTMVEGQPQQQAQQQRTAASSSEALNLTIPPLERPHSGSRPHPGGAVSQHAPTHSWSGLQRAPPPAPQHSRLPVQSSFDRPSAQQMLPAPMLVPVTPPAAAATTTTTATTNHPAAQSPSASPQSQPSSSSNISPPPLLYPTGPPVTTTPSAAVTAPAPAVAAAAASDAASSSSAPAALRVVHPLLPTMPAGAPVEATDTVARDSASVTASAAAPVAAAPAAAPAAAVASPSSPDSVGTGEDDSPPDLIAPAHTT